MVPPTRRRVLHGAAGLASALAGCGGLLDGTGESSRTSPTATAGESDFAGSESDPENLAIRADTDRPPVWLADPDQADGGRPTESEHSYLRTNALVDSRERADRVAVADVPGADRVGAFLDATAFDSETVYVETHQVGECFRLELCSVSWRPDEVQTDYARVTRPYDEACRADRKVFAVRLVRIPAALDADSVNGFGSSIGSGSCDRGPMADSEMAAASSDDATATEPSEQSTETTEGSQ
ncbi:hypothetical protein [Haloarcula pellucida]|uniref:hypothetical protein n=1 Tax=Haloarcula pellucida TaxID=1427151 RepID=UPI001664B809|nr:hypothetical protein [Halomicroarcula pellucida]MBX0346785.1 hypothetical protein [Halomicroarcula pellucida]